MAYFYVGVEFDQLSNKVNSRDIGDADEPSCCLTERLHHRRAVACIALPVDLNPLLDVACPQGQLSPTRGQARTRYVLSSLPSICEPPWQTGPSRSFSSAIAIDEVPVRE